MAKFNYAQYQEEGVRKPDKGTPAYFAQKYDIARKNLLSVVVFTTINVILLLLNSSMYMLFSAAIPYYFPAIATVIDNELLSGHTLTIIAYAVSLASILFYLLCWQFSRERRGWMIAALVVFILDFLVLIAFMLLSSPADFLLDIAFHIWVVWYLISGVRNSKKLLRAVQENPPASVYSGPEF